MKGKGYIMVYCTSIIIYIGGRGVLYRGGGEEGVLYRGGGCIIYRGGGGCVKYYIHYILATFVY